MQSWSRYAALIQHPKGVVEEAAGHSALFKHIAKRPVGHGLCKTDAILYGVCDERGILRTPLRDQERKMRQS